ncbi:hypothetical protein BV22DRAFT_1024058 [Leucogyrophana mollusca]|uniref:Uncharacterized protein n=1 Tax=Leucogyrophana mollusca TaxID=85980 RepID=A0ACB8AZN5_9AGAM|nr:hypothetical protein BV22DRAFT_1024058 [Leucogyrophana mollusca]
MYICAGLTSNHIPLNQHLHHIAVADSPCCPACPETDESLHHFLFDCPQYAQEHHVFGRAIGQEATSLSYILTEEHALGLLIQFVNATVQLRHTFSEVSLPEHNAARR